MLMRLFLVLSVSFALSAISPRTLRTCKSRTPEFRGTDTLMVVKRVTDQPNDTFFVVVKAAGVHYEGRDNVTRTGMLHGNHEEPYDDFNILPDGDIEEYQPTVSYPHGEDTVYLHWNWIKFPIATKKQAIAYVEMTTTRNSTLYLADTVTYLGVDTVKIAGKRYPTIKMQNSGDALTYRGLANVRSLYWYSPDYRAFLSQISLFDWGGIDYEVIRVMP